MGPAPIEAAGNGPTGDTADAAAAAGPAGPIYTVAVRALCEFSARQGDLDLRFTPSPTAQEGIAGHGLVASRRGPGYEAEVPLAGRHGRLHVRGRADGYDPALNRLEEVKTFRGLWASLPANQRHLHWAQLRVYGALLCAQRGLASVELALVYFDLGSQQETVLTELGAAPALQRHFEALCDRFAAWAAQETAHRLARDAALQRLAFAHAAFRPGQRALAEAVYKATVAGRCLLAQAPTGIGKTVGTLFPMLKACPGQRLDKVFFLTAKSSGRAVALQALALLRSAGRSGCAGPGLPLRTLELVARDKACEHPDKACHGDACPLAHGFYDRLPGARQAAVEAAIEATGRAAVGASVAATAAPAEVALDTASSGSRGLDQATLRLVALAHRVCPYYLGQELARWCDVVVGDCNYYFDHSALLHGLTQAYDWRVGLLVDEAHNLVNRGRKMYSARLDQGSLARLRRAVPTALKRPLDRLQRCWSALNKPVAADYAVLDGLPGPWLQALQHSVGAIAEHLDNAPQLAAARMESPLESPNEPLMDFYFDALQFTRLAESFGPHSLCDWSRSDGTVDGKTAGAGRGYGLSALCIRNVVPGPFLQPRFAAARSATLFSATMQPAHFYVDLLGLPADTAVVDIDSPFEAGQLQVHIAPLSTRFADRQRSLPALVDRMAAQFQARPGNYLAFFSSHDYLQQACAAMAWQHPQITCWAQTRGMTEADQRAFLARLTPDSQGIGFAVLGGSFAEGVDLPGRRLIGAFIATLGLPQINPVNEQMRLRLHALTGAGYDYTYVFPGLQKVVQAAGRVIRGAHDRGVLHLMDDRYLQPRIQRLLPAWWSLA